MKLQKDGATLVIDPGSFPSGAEAIAEADAVLVTHEHADHLDEDGLRIVLTARPDLQVWSNESVARKFPDHQGQVHPVRQGDVVAAAGFDVHVYGERHAFLHPDIPAPANTGYLVDGAIFHPGDALTVPDQPVDTLLVPVTAPWLKAAEFVDCFREVSPRQGYAIHDGMLNDFGLMIIGSWMEHAAAPVAGSLTRLPPGASLDL